MNDQNKNRHNDEGFREEVELTTVEKKELEELRKDAVPSDSLEERIVGALYEHGLLMKPHRHMIQFTISRAIAAAAACLVLFVTGFVIGQQSALRNSSGTDSVEEANIGFSIAASVQQTGSAYLMALQRLASMPVDLDCNTAIQGQEIALKSLSTAAEKISHIVPKDLMLGQLLASLDGDTGSWKPKESKDVTIHHNQIIWF